MPRILSRKWLTLPLEEEEWRQIKRYEHVPLKKKLELLDRMREFMFALWKENPSMRRNHEKSLLP